MLQIHSCRKASGSTAVIHCVLMYVWCMSLKETDSYYTVYLVCLMLGILTRADNQKTVTALPVSAFSCMLVFSGLFSCVTLAANYPLFELPADSYHAYQLIEYIAAFAGGAAVAWNILFWIYTHIPMEPSGKDRSNSAAFFWFVFLSVAAIDLIYLFTAAYPGIMTADTFGSVREIMEGSYANINPFWYTKTIEFFYRIGSLIFDDINAAFAVVTVCFCLFYVGSIAYSLTTMYSAKVPGGFIVCAYIVSALLPHSIVYSVTLWKDILFSSSALVLVTALYRILCHIGKIGVWDYFCSGSALPASVFPEPTAGMYIWHLLSYCSSPL